MPRRPGPLALLARNMWSPPQAVCHQTWSPLQAGCHPQGPTRFATIHRVAHGSHRFIVCSRHSRKSLPNPWLGGNHGFGKLDPVLLVLVVRFHTSHRLVVKFHDKLEVFNCKLSFSAIFIRSCFSFSSSSYLSNVFLFVYLFLKPPFSSPPCRDPH